MDPLLREFCRVAGTFDPSFLWRVQQHIKAHVLPKLIRLEEAEHEIADLKLEIARLTEGRRAKRPAADAVA